MGLNPILRPAGLTLAAMLALTPVHAQQPQPPRPPAAAPAPPAPPPVPKSYLTQFLVPGSHFHGVHGLAFDRDDQLFAGSVVGQSVYKVQVETGEVETRIPGPEGMADDIAFSADGAMAWTSFLTGIVHARAKPDQPIKQLATGLPGINSLAFTKEGRLFATQVFLGDALWEIDTGPLKPDAKPDTPLKPPRKVMEGMGGLNGFEFGPDGLLYGPLWFRGQVVKVDVDKATVTVVADGFKVPAAVNFDSNGSLYVVDTALGQVVRVETSSGQKTLVATVRPSIDNLAIDSRNRLFITNMADNGVYHVDAATGQVRTVVEGRLAVPADIAVHSEGGKDTLHLPDIFSYRTVDGASGEVTTVLRMQSDALEYPFGVAVNAKHVILTSWFTNSVQKIERASGKPLAMLHDFKAPVDAIEAEDGSLLVLELGTGSLVRVKGADGKDRTTVAKELNAPVAMASAGPGAVYVTELATGAVVRIVLATGAKNVIVSGLKAPEGIDVAPDGRLIVAEVGLRRLIAIDPKDGAITPLATNLAIGLPGFQGGPPAYVPTGVAVGRSGAIYVTSDVRNAIYKLTPQY
jgi:sugar lactone lactonase YvrE